jgi:hypothetical protein
MQSKVALYDQNSKEWKWKLHGDNTQLLSESKSIVMIRHRKHNVLYSAQRHWGVKASDACMMTTNRKEQKNNVAIVASPHNAEVKTQSVKWEHNLRCKTHFVKWPIKLKINPINIFNSSVLFYFSVYVSSLDDNKECNCTVILYIFTQN